MLDVVKKCTIAASILKGNIRFTMEAGKGDVVKSKVEDIMGKADQGDFASAVAFSDASLLFFPVKSVNGIFAWVTCPFALKRFINDCKLVGNDLKLKGSSVGYLRNVSIQRFRFEA